MFHVALSYIGNLLMGRRGNVEQEQEFRVGISFLKRVA